MPLERLPGWFGAWCGVVWHTGVWASVCMGSYNGTAPLCLSVCLFACLAVCVTDSMDWHVLHSTDAGVGERGRGRGGESPTRSYKDTQVHHSIHPSHPHAHRHTTPPPTRKHTDRQRDPFVRFNIYIQSIVALTLY
mmetsp:Transcript_16271/g.38935  ORF Transcript_16271/g.38935 Transcript_16271/m.38935 type:complete len:136 (-) Transcript_16271:366-773(-)